MPPKPKKLTPIFSKKRSEIMQQTLSSSNLGEEQVAVKKVKKVPRTPKGDHSGSTEIRKKVKKKRSSQREINDEENYQEGETHYVRDTNSAKSTRESKNKFDSIWDPEQLAPKLSDNNGNQLSTIGEEFAPLKVSRTKSYLGGKVAKIEDASNNPDSSSTKREKAEMNSNDNARLVEEYNKAQSSASSFNHHT